jgi:hypothetical protein
VPETITSDCGLQFTSNFWLQICEMLNISHRQTIAYHPESNGSQKTAPPPQGCTSRMHPRGDMVRRITLCTPRTSRTAEGRDWSFPG